MRFFRAAAVYLLNVLVATVLIGVVTNPFPHYEAQTDPYFIIHREYLLSALAALGVGFSVYWTWRQKASKWVWVVSMWSRAECYSETLTTSSGKFPEAIVATPLYRAAHDAMDSVLFLRTVFYSVGALCASPVPKFHFDSLKRVFPGLFSLIGEKDPPS